MKKKIFLLISLIGVLLIFTNLSQGWQSVGGKNRDLLPIEGHPNQDEALCASLSDKNETAALDKVTIIPFGRVIFIFSLSKLKPQINSSEKKVISNTFYKKQK